MTGLHFRSALLPDGWHANVRIEVSEGRITLIASGQPKHASDEFHGTAIAGTPNLHSHAFQRAMAGLTQRRTHATDDFWSWRETMYRFALTMTPDDLEAVATQLYVEMLEAGFTQVGEFHYLHHAPDGRPYASIAEMAERILAAAGHTGIGVTLLPVFYRQGGFGGAPPNPQQRRFVTDPDLYARLLEHTRRAAARLPGCIVGVAPHSLRAVTPADLAIVTSLAGGPIHIHAAEQTREVDDCIAWSGSPPVQWLLDHASVDGRWCVVHATHMRPDETERLAQSGAAAGLCPLTEADLGDGTFDAGRFIAGGGSFGIGSDSNIAIDAAAELRQLEYSQRLHVRRRNVMARPGASTGRILFDAALDGGGRALGRRSVLAVGNRADIVALDDRHPSFPCLVNDQLLDAWIFSAGRSMVQSVWANGRRLVTAGRHHLRDHAASSYQTAIIRLTAT